MSTVAAIRAIMAAFFLLLGIVSGAVQHSDSTQSVEINSHHFSVHHSSAETSARNKLVRREAVQLGAKGYAASSKSNETADVTWGSYKFNYIANTKECVEDGVTDWEGKSLFQTWNGTDSGLTMSLGTTLSSGDERVPAETHSGLMIYKAACPNATAVRVGGTMLIPASATTAELVFGITRRCTGDCAPFMVSVIEEIEETGVEHVKYRWCFNREGSVKFEGHGCNETRRVPFHTWNREELKIGDHLPLFGTNMLKLALEVYTSGDFRFLPTLPGEVGLGGRAMVLIDSLLFGPIKRPTPESEFLGQSKYCRQSMREVCKENSWCGDKYRCYSGWCSEGKGRCNKERNCEDDSDEVGCEYNNGFRAEFFLNHARQIHANTDLDSLTHPDIRVMHEVIEYDADDFHTKWGARDRFAVKWMGNFSINKAGQYNFKFKPTDTNHSEARLTLHGVGANADMPMVNVTSGEWFRLTSAGAYQLTLSYVHNHTGSPSMTLKFSGADTRGETIVFGKRSTGYQSKQSITATMTGARCDTMNCAAGEGFVFKPGHEQYLCHGVPCSQAVDTSTCCTRQYKVVSCGDYRTCALDLRGRPVCWGSWAGFNEEWRKHPGPFRDISTRGKYICGVKQESGMVDCWQPDDATAEPVDYSVGATFSTISVGGDHTCALRDSGYPACSGSVNMGNIPISPPSNVEFSSVSSGNSFTCGIATQDREVKCWGSNEHGESAPPTGTGHTSYTHLSAGHEHACGISNGTAHCWGSNNDDQGRPTGQATAPTGHDFAQVAAGGYHTCALKEDGHPVCWGSDAAGQSTPRAESGPFSSISAGRSHTCAIRRVDNEMVCWGSNFEEDYGGELQWRGQASPPPAIAISYG